MLLNKSSRKQAHKTFLEKPFTFSYEAMGTWWEVRIWDKLTEKTQTSLKESVIQLTHEFDQTYSRFISTSYIMKAFSAAGRKDIPIELYEMLRLYEKFYDATKGKITPLIGQALVDAGYDANYSLVSKEISSTPDFKETIEFISASSIYLHRPVVLDLGAIGKGYFVDVLSAILKKEGCTCFLINGSGDLTYITPLKDDDIKIGLEHPDDPKKVIGTTKISNVSLCSSGSNRRSWGNYHHILDPQTKSSPTKILATWVIAEGAALADGLATSLYLIPSSQLKKTFTFEYAILDNTMTISRSKGFSADLY